jgi:mono/diheme cytochrome c family protein
MGRHDTLRSRAVRILGVGIAVAAVWTLACSGGDGGDPVEAGRRAYVANCTACHNQDPRKDGTMGPAVAGASLELLEARVLRAEYPPGYTPKRDSRLMPAQPFLKAEIPALAAYLGSLAPPP